MQILINESNIHPISHYVSLHAYKLYMSRGQYSYLADNIVASHLQGGGSDSCVSVHVPRFYVCACVR